MFLIFKIENKQQPLRVNIDHLVAYARQEHEPNKSIIILTGREAKSSRKFIVEHTVEDIDKTIESYRAGDIRKCLKW